MNKQAAVKSAKSTVAQSVPGYGLIAAVVSQLDGVTWWHALIIPALPLLDALVTYLHRLRVPHVKSVGAYIDAVEQAAKTAGDDDLATDVDRAEGE